MDETSILQELSPDQTDEQLKLKLLNEILPAEDKAPDENIVQAIFRIIRKPTIPEASEGVYDAAVTYLKSISRY